jgi:co-chaperonin GroES (HSP10)
MSDLKDLKGKSLGKDKTSDELKFEVHPNLLFAKRLLKDKTEGGIYLPENAQKGSTPIVQLMAIGKNIKEQFTEDGECWLEVGDYVYCDPRFMEIAIIDEVAGVMLHADSIYGKIPQPSDTVITPE